MPDNINTAYYLSFFSVRRRSLGSPYYYTVGRGGDFNSAVSKEAKSGDNADNRDAAGKKAEKNELKEKFVHLKKRYGFAGAVREIFGFAGQVLKKIKKRLKHFFIKKVCVNIVIAGDDAAQTAVEYGAVCGSVYPVLAFLESTAVISLKKINISSDFYSGNSDFSFSLDAGARVIFLIMTLFDIFSEYNNFKMRNEL